MRNCSFVLALLLFSAISINAQTNSDPTDDAQFWPDLTLRLNLTEKTSLDFFGTARLGQNVSRFVSELVGIAVIHRPSPYLNLNASYRSVWTQPASGNSLHEHRAFFDVTPRLPLKKGIVLSDRNRVEFREINHQSSVRYRNRYQVEKSFELSEKMFTSYVAGEVYYDTRFHSWGRKQLWAGIRVPLHPHLSCDFMYMHNWDARARPGYWNVFGVLTRIEF